MEEMRRVAFECVARACAFGSLAIFCLMVGLSFDPRLALQTGGILTLTMALILILKSVYVRRQNHKRTEMWLCLPKESRPPTAYAQRVTATVLRDTYLRFALWTSATSIMMWVLALGASITGLGST